MDIAGIGLGMNSISSAAQSAKGQQEIRTFQALIDGINAGINTSTSDSASKNTDMVVDATAAIQKKSITDGTLSSSQFISDSRLPGDIISSFALKNPTEADTHAPVQGAAANAGLKGTIDKTSALYEKSLELESYFVKMMLSSMRSTVSKSGLIGGKDNFAQNTYEDMMYDELAVTLTKNAGFGLADQIYVQLSNS